MEKEKIDKKDHILDVAERVFAEKGFDGASTRLISGEAGVNMAMLNYYFGSKEGLFLAIIERKISHFQNILQNLGNKENISTWEKMETYVELYGDKIVNNNCFQQLLYKEMVMNRGNELSDKLREMLMKNVGELERILKEGIASGEFNADVDIPMVIAALYGTKNYIINTPLMASPLLGYDIRDDEMIEKKLKPQIKSFMKNLLKCYLLKQQ
ncbi:TetR/AcrR family transcriptional regulator [Mucilaginibacter auburnensis]|uniref:AcrR family transcriptional regulator n=1 Tax=Mucilaginibacter auburnensis TaxID=1457233 RepID=A0A2H9VTE8_9SPHI|nr:TetR/AcrR family transcriptional regulator [Mucilaginibacter auburnensis]PJJ84091.1 AcrR family transcriptional regulator [Mucilaginibacter auburnensis]